MIAAIQIAALQMKWRRPVRGAAPSLYGKIIIKPAPNPVNALPQRR
ncbi:hypothetical protein [Bradyrhizobium sp. ORS 111]